MRRAPINVVFESGDNAYLVDLDDCALMKSLTN